MVLAILATGDEIVHGDTFNTNGHAIAQILSSEGISLGMHLACSDKEKDIVCALEFLSAHHDIVLIIGGLGPTTDDKTRFALAQFTKLPLVAHQQALLHLHSRLKNIQVPLLPGNHQQCLFPQEATLFPNPYGSALGCQLLFQGKTFFLLPGPPRECLPMFNQYVLPPLQQSVHSQKQILKWRIFGLAESEIAHHLEEALKGIDCNTGYRWEAPYIEFKVRCRPELVGVVRAIVDPLLSPHIISPPNQKASEVLCERIMTLKNPINIVDEATGGILEMLLNKPAVHNLLKFHPNREKDLSFHITGLNAFWAQKKEGQTELMIHYHSPSQKGEETHFIPYRAASIQEYAAEWLSFRLFHLINELHQSIT